MFRTLILSLLLGVPLSAAHADADVNALVDALARARDAVPAQDPAAAVQA